MSLSLVDILFLITVVLLVLSGLRNGAVLSLISLVGLPIGLAAAYYYGPAFAMLLANNGLSVTPLIAYGVLVLGVVLIVHIIGHMVHGVVKSLPVISQADALLGGAIGFVEAWLLWLFLLIVLGTFLGSAQAAIHAGSQTIPGFSIQVSQLTQWHNFYNQAVTNSLFAKVNGFFIKALPNLPQP